MCCIYIYAFHILLKQVEGLSNGHSCKCIKIIVFDVLSILLGVLQGIRFVDVCYDFVPICRPNGLDLILKESFNYYCQQMAPHIHSTS